MLELCNVSYYYTSYRGFAAYKHYVLRHIDLKLEVGQNIAIMGKSGCGKSTLAKIACGLLRPQRDEAGAVGEVRLHSVPINICNLSFRRAFCAQVQILFQDSIGSLNPHFTCLENCLEPLVYLKACEKKEAIERIYMLMEDLALPKDILFKQVGMISGGEAQRICLVRALSIKPRVLILDESTSGLDYELSLHIMDYLKRWQRGNKSAIMLISHDEHIARGLCGRVYMMNTKGELET